MTTSTLRFAIIVALIVGGVVVIGQAFPEGSTRALPAGTETPTTPASPSGAGGAGGGGNGAGQQQEEPGAQLKGVQVAVYNGTDQVGLAAAVADKLERRFEVKIDHETGIADAQSKPWNPTTIFFISTEDKPAAEALRSTFFKKLDGAEVKKLPADYSVPNGVRLAVYLGTDYLQQQ